MNNANKIQAVLFDADEVMIPPWRFARFLVREHGFEPGKTDDFFRGVFVDCLKGKADLKEVLPPYLEKWNWSSSLDDFVTAWFREEHVVDEQVKSVVGALRSEGVCCGLASNQEKYRAEYIRKEMGFEQFFDHIFFSSDLGAVKPEARYYESIAATLNVKPAEILFFDDSPGHVKAAVDAGWNALHFTGLASLQSGLAKILPNFSICTPFEVKQGDSIDLTSIELETERLLLKSITFEYLDAIFENFTESLVRYMASSAPSEKSETEDFIIDSMQKQKRGDNLVVAILNKSTKGFLGCCGLHGRGKANTPELGIWIKETAHGNGYGREAVTAVKRWAEENLVYDYLIYPVDRNNVSSRKIPELLGGEVFEEKLVTTDSGKQLDEVVYRILHPDKPKDAGK